MKSFKTILKIVFALAAIAAALFALAVYIDKIIELFNRRTEIKDKVFSGVKNTTDSFKSKADLVKEKTVNGVKGKTETWKEKAIGIKSKAVTNVKDTSDSIKQKMPSKDAIIEKLPSKEDLIRLNPFRKAEIEAEFADYADVE